MKLKLSTLIHSRGLNMNKLLRKYLDQATTYHDYHFSMRNQEKADKGVIDFINAKCNKDRRLYTPSKRLYEAYKVYCDEIDVTPLSSWQFKRNMQILGFVYVPKKRFYNQVTTGFKNVGLNG